MCLTEWLPGEAPEPQPPLPDGLGDDLASRLCVNQLWGRLLCLSPLLLRNYLFIFIYLFGCGSAATPASNVKNQRNTMNEGQVPGRQEGGQGWGDRQLGSTTQFVDNFSHDRVCSLPKRMERTDSKFPPLLFLLLDAGVNPIPRLRESS